MSDLAGSDPEGVERPDLRGSRNSVKGSVNIISFLLFFLHVSMAEIF